MKSVIKQWPSAKFFEEAKLDRPEGDIGVGIERFVQFIDGAERVSAADLRFGKSSGQRVYHLAECGTLEFAYGLGGISAIIYHDAPSQRDLAENLISAAFVKAQISGRIL